MVPGHASLQHRNQPVSPLQKTAFNQLSLSNYKVCKMAKSISYLGSVYLWLDFFRSLHLEKDLDLNQDRENQPYAISF